MNNVELQEGEMTDKPQDETVKGRITALLGKGYSRSQLINDFEFAERSVDAAIKAYKKTNNGNAEKPDEADGPVADNGTTARTAHKNGVKGADESPRAGSLAIGRDKESVLPEWLRKDVAELFDGEIRDQKIFLAGVNVPLMGLRLFTEGVRPMIDLLSVWQAGQVEAARAAQGSGTEIAQAAAAGAAARAVKHIDDRLHQLIMQKLDSSAKTPRRPTEAVRAIQTPPHIVLGVGLNGTSGIA